MSHCEISNYEASNYEISNNEMCSYVTFKMAFRKITLRLKCWQNSN